MHGTSGYIPAELSRNNWPSGSKVTLSIGSANSVLYHLPRNQQQLSKKKKEKRWSREDEPAFTSLCTGLTTHCKPTFLPDKSKL
jgi:hypothetical protein